jgi:2-polyprenyl-3-methyl-5-hydroxy-6-metoxy-1,4-benzoquinol methylase
MPDFAKRSEQIEIMDDFELSGEIIDVTLKELETINLLLGGNHVTLNGISRLIKDRNTNEKLVIADLGCGSGDILKLIRKMLNKRGIPAVLIGIDANKNIVRFAAENTSTEDDIRYEAIDIFSEEFARKKFDIVTGTLFFHHFSSGQLINFFRQLKDQVRIGIVINDIHRHWFAYRSINLLTRLFSKSYMVKHDAGVSVMRAFRKNELEKIIQKAGFARYTLRWMWAFRWQVVIDVR